METSLYSILIWITAIAIGSLAAVIYVGSDRLSSRAFAFSLFWVTAWVMQVGLFISAESPSRALVFARLCYLFGIAIALSFLYFFFTFPEDRKPPKPLAGSLVLFQLFLTILFIFTDGMIVGVKPMHGLGLWTWDFGNISFVFETVFFGSFAIGTWMLYKKFCASADNKLRNNLGYMLLAIIIGTLPVSVICIILPRFGSFTFNALGPVLEMVWVPIVAYSIIKYRQMDVRAIFAEALALTLFVIFVLHVFIPQRFEQIGHIVALSIFLVFVYLLIKSILKEEQQREQLRSLNEKLNDLVIEQTKQIKEAYEAERSARMNLEKLNEAKDQFITIAQHNLRSPLSNIFSTIRSIVDRPSGRTSHDVSRALSSMQKAESHLGCLMDDLLSIASIKPGSSILNLQEADIKQMLHGVLDELGVMIRDSNISTRFDDIDWPLLTIDKSKIRECLYVILENAVHYNHHNGHISIMGRYDDRYFKIAISNSGIGISKEESERLGSAAFYRGTRARKVRSMGMGVGLSLVKTIIHAHQGLFSIESEGEGRGAKVTLAFPHIK